MLPVLLLLLATESVVKVPPSHWTAIQLKADHNNTTALVDFEVRNGGKIQALVMTRAEAERVNRGRPNRSLYTTGFKESARFRVVIPDAGEYIVLLDNRLEARFPAEVILRLETTHSDNSKVGYVPDERRRLTIALSLLFFARAWSSRLLSSWRN